MEYIVTYGRLDFFANKDNDFGLETLIISSQESVREMALRFITVIPDDLDYYIQYINDWQGQEDILALHQDDDTFYFATKPITSTKDNLKNFNNFVTTFEVPQEEE